MKDDEEINKYLTEAMGGCWHRARNNNERICRLCMTSVYGGIESINPDFSTATGYDKAREFYDGWDEEKSQRFMRHIYSTVHKNYPSEQILHAFHKDNLAKLMMKFLQGEEQ
jgi:hypothetical protein